MADVRSLVRAQREVLGSFLEGLTGPEWERTSLCPAWRVHDVVAHCIQSHVATPWRLTGELLRSGFSLTRRNERWVRQRASRSRAELLEALDRSIDVPADALTIVAATCRSTGMFLGGKQRCAGLTLRASDVAWSAGSGPEVSGPAAALVMASTGRAAALDQLSGDGLVLLRPRL